MLFLVGTGVSSRDISVAAIEACGKSELYIERYTSLVSRQRIEYLNKLLGKEITELSREDLEEGARGTVAKAAAKDIAILVGGDPLAATTHKILMIEARKQGIEAKVIHASSVVQSAIGESGLDFYRFGQVCTIPRWTDRYKPVSFYETIERNIAANLHSLVLLDYYPEREGTLPVRDAITELFEAEAKYRKGIIADTTTILLMYDVGTDEQKAILTNIGAAKGANEGRMAIIIIPARLSGVEEEALHK